MTDRPRGQWKIHLAFMLVASVACLLWSWRAGRDLNWDQLNYHLYAAYQLLDDRVERDFMAASIQGYLNPLAYVPFYAMVRAGWHSLLIGSVLALLHSSCLWLIYGISRILIPAGAPFRTTLIAACVAFAFLTPVYMVEIGSSFIDVTTTIPVLAGVLLLMLCRQRNRGGPLIVAAGLLMGSATALKLTNAIFPVAAVVFILMTSRPFRLRIGDLARYGAGGLAGFALVGGAWCYRLYSVFGSPFFPWFNAWFGAPDFPRFNIVSYRFMPESFVDVLLFPVAMLDVGQRGYTETMSPDGRLLAFLVIIAGVGAAWLLRGGRAFASPDRNGFAEGRAGRAYPASLAFALLSYALWLATSGNGRYGMPLLLFVGPLIPASVLIMSRSGRVLAYSIGGLLLVQAMMIGVIGPIRWMGVEWKSTWYDLDVPDSLKSKPYLYLSLNRQTAAFLAPFLNRGSSFVNLVGQVSLAFDRPGGPRLRALLERHRPNIRTLMMPTLPDRDGQPQQRVVDFQNRELRNVGLEVDTTDCITFLMHDLAGLAPVAVTRPGESGLPLADPRTTFLSCATRPLQTARGDPQLAERRARTDQVFARLEAACPRLFSPAGPLTDHVNEKLRRTYVNTDTEVWELGGQVEYQGWMYDVPVPLGRAEDIASGRVRIDCRFARVPPSVVRQ